MGVKWRTGESWIATSGGICKASAIRRVGGHRRWDAEGLLQVKGVPWDHVQKDADPGEVHVRWLDPSFLGQRGSETMSRSSHHHHDLAHSICRATLDNIHGLKFRHWRETAAPTRLVGVCYKQIFQPRTVGAGECATLAKSKAHTKSPKSTV